MSTAAPLWTTWSPSQRGSNPNLYIARRLNDLIPRYDFFLVSQSVTQGTVNPTSYNIVKVPFWFTLLHWLKQYFPGHVRSEAGAHAEVDLQAGSPLLQLAGNGESI